MGVLVFSAITFKNWPSLFSDGPFIMGRFIKCYDRKNSMKLHENAPLKSKAWDIPVDAIYIFLNTITILM